MRAPRRHWSTEVYEVPPYRDMTPEESRARHMAQPTHDEKQAGKDRAFIPSGRPPRLVCAECRKGPLDGVAIHKREGVFRCAEHMTAGDET